MKSFIFRHIDSPIHNLDPRSRLLLSIELFLLALLSNQIYEIIFTFFIILSLAFTGKIIKKMLRTLILSLFFASVIFLTNVLVGMSLIDSSVLALRFISIVASTSFFFLSTSPDELEHIMRWFHVPRDVIFAFVTAIRFVPVLLLDALQILDAQKSRGLEVDRGNFISRIKKTAPVLIPLIISAVVRSGELAEAMESRAYGATKKPTTLYGLKLTTNDKIITLLSLVSFSFTAYLYSNELYLKLLF